MLYFFSNASDRVHLFLVGYGMAKSVWLQPVDGYEAWLLVWTRNVLKEDVAPVFAELTQMLDTSPKPLWVIVDLRADPVFPFIETVTAALRGPFRHRNLREWLVVGANVQALIIGRTLSSLSSRTNIRWFTTISQAYAHMSDQTPSPSDLSAGSS